jgi:methionine synthase I (cobalamin-dependent)
MHDTIAALIADGPVVLDGSWGTLLQETTALAPGGCPDQLNLSEADAVAAVADAYAAAGSRIVLTNSFGGGSIRLADFDLAEHADAINQRAAELSLQARAAHPGLHVFGALGPTGRMLMMGDVDEAELHDCFAGQAATLAAAGVDGLVLETFAELEEATVAIRACRSVCALPVVACMVFDAGKDHDRTMMGTTPEAAATTLAEAGADVIGANCGAGAAPYAAVCRRMREAVDLPLWMKPNAGVPVMQGATAVFTETADGFATAAAALADAGASFIGGCCGTRPAFIARLAETLSP